MKVKYSRFWFHVARLLPMRLVYHVFLVASAAFCVVHKLSDENSKKVPVVTVLRWLQHGAPHEVKP